MNDQHLDDILNNLKQTPNQFYGYKLVFDNLKIPFSEADVLLTTLERNGHIEIKSHPVWDRMIKIKSEGIEFINRTSYKEHQSHNSNEISRHLTLNFADGFGVNDKVEEKPKSVYEKIIDNPKWKFWGWFIVALATIISTGLAMKSC